jgi:metal-responsive CopG/Arc/MetJ family transcriptional regulator
MSNKREKLMRATISLDPADYRAMRELANETDVSTSRLIRQAMREFLGRYGDGGQPEFALRVGSRSNR